MKNSILNKKTLILVAAIIILLVAIGMSIDKFIDITKQFPDLVFGILFGVGGYLISQAMSSSKAEITKSEAKDYIREKKVCNDSRQECGLDAAIALTERNLNAVMARYREYYNFRAIDQNFHNDLPMLSILFSDIDRCSSDVDSIRKLMDSFLESDSSDIIRENNKNNCKPINAKEKNKNKEIFQNLGTILRDVKEAYNRRTETLNILSKEDIYKKEDYQALFNVMSSDLAKALQTLNEICGFSLRNDNLRIDIQLVIDYLKASLGHADKIKKAIQDNNKIVVFEVMRTDITDAINKLSKYIGAKKLKDEIPVDAMDEKF